MQHMPAKHRQRRSFRKGEHRKQDQMGTTVYKGHPSWQLALNIKAGLKHTIEQTAACEVAAKPPRYPHAEVTQFPIVAGPSTPRHPAEDTFLFKSYEPVAFHRCRERCGLSCESFIESICGTDSLRELGTPGKSGAVFYLTQDGRHLIKTVSKTESKFLRLLTPAYAKHLQQFPESLLPRFLGHIKITSAGGRSIRLVLMNNLMPPEVPISQKFDLKGSSVGRYATAKEHQSPNVTLKDLDLKHCIKMDPLTHSRFTQQLTEDLRFLRSQHVMDYSLLVGVHLQEPGQQQQEFGPAADSDSDCSNSEEQELERPSSVAPTPYNTPQPDPQTDLQSQRPCTTRFHGQLVPCRGEGAPLDTAPMEAEIYCGIIDVLQQFRPRKELESTIKRAVYFRSHNGISVMPPSPYASRFQAFMLSKFVTDRNSSESFLDCDMLSSGTINTPFNGSKYGCTTLGTGSTSATSSGLDVTYEDSVASLHFLGSTAMTTDDVEVYVQTGHS